jgi:hypothetical protein
MNRVFFPRCICRALTRASHFARHLAESRSTGYLFHVPLAPPLLRCRRPSHRSAQLGDTSASRYKPPRSTDAASLSCGRIPPTRIVLTNRPPRHLLRGPHGPRFFVSPRLRCRRRNSLNRTWPPQSLTASAHRDERLCRALNQEAATRNRHRYRPAPCDATRPA